MKLIEAIPAHPKVKQYVDRYQYFDLSEPAFLKTIPNGKLDCWTAINGYFEIWDFNNEEFIPMGSAGIMPATNQMSLIRIASHLTCLNIKMKLSVIGLNIMRSYVLDISKQNIASFLSRQTKSEIVGKQFLKANMLDIEALDRLVLPYLENRAEIEEPNNILSILAQNTSIGLNDLANQMNMTPKSLERLTKKLFGLTPMELFKIFRFEKTTAYLQKNESAKLIEALDFGYYDQSHFIKTCKKITGTSPRKLFDKMKLPTNDLLID